jgi:hypothetical protein
MNLFWLLQELNNADKHRLVQLAGIKTSETFSSFMFGFKPTTLTYGQIREAVLIPKGGVFLEDGARIGTIDASVVEAEPELKIVPITGEPIFAEGCDAVRGLPVRRTLNQIGARVARMVWVEFGPYFAPFPPEWS